jgi:hypothetical protein
MSQEEQKEQTESTAKRYFGLLKLEELVLLSLYPATVLLGQLVCLANPHPSYFGEKRNIFNVIFVRQGWFWTTIAFIAHATHVHKNNNNTNRQSLLKQQILRYTLATIWWYTFSQWLFGLPIMDRVFVITGGTCEGVAGVADGTTMTSAACRSHGGKWVGGHDPSGHSFLLVHSSLFLWFEILPTLRKQTEVIPGAVKGVFVLLCLWWWMLLMTSIYFHSFLEKMAGLVWGLIEVSVVYIILSNNPQAADTLGLSN